MTNRPFSMRSTSVLIAVIASTLPLGCAEQPNGTTSVEAGAGESAASGLPSYWFESDFESWIGKPWREIELFKLMETAPSAMDSGTRYVVFYSRTCEHCESMFYEDFPANPELAAAVTAVEVPADKQTMTSPDAWPLPSMGPGEMLELPLGVNWIIATPLAVRIENGVVACAEENDHRGCLGLE